MKESPKTKLYSLCQQFLNERKQVIEEVIKDIHVSLTSETKSSAGDKHETGRAMLQLEREKAGVQLREIQSSMEVLNKVELGNSSNTVRLGSVVYTTGVHYYIAISAGKLEIEGDTFYAISPTTPMGKLLLGKTIGEKIQFGSRIFTITEIE